MIVITIMQQYLTITEEQIKGFTRASDPMGCITAILQNNNAVSYYEETAKKGCIYRNCDILAINSDSNIIIRKSGVQYNIKLTKPFLFCIPIICLQYNTLDIDDISDNSTFYRIFLQPSERIEFAQNAGAFFFAKDMDWFPHIIAKPHFQPSIHITPLFKSAQGNYKTFIINSFNRKMNRLTNILLNAKLDRKHAMLLFLLRHHAIPPPDALFIPCAVAHEIV